MKKANLFILFFLLTLGIFAQKFPIDSISKLITYSDVIAVNNTSKTELFFRASKWFARTYKDANFSWQVQDKEMGNLLSKGRMKIDVTYFLGKVDGGVVTYTVQIICKDNRYKYVITDFYHDGKETNSRTGGNLENEINRTNYLQMPIPSQWQEIREQVDVNARAIVNDLVKFMSSKDKNDW